MPSIGHDLPSEPTPLPALTVLSASTNERLDSIDAFRGIAALGVALYHIWGHDGTYPWHSIGVVTQSAQPHWLSYLDFPLRWGYLGVSLFLVLSGFCIHLPQARRKLRDGAYGLKPREFFLRRIWRLYPAYALAVVGTSLLLWVAPALLGSHLGTHSERPGFWDIVAHLTFLHGYTESTFYSIASVFWSLALEFQLYLAYPFFLWLFRKTGTARALLILTIVALAWRYFALNVQHEGLISISADGPFASMGSVLARMPEWLLGAWLAEIYLKRDTLKRFRLVRRPALLALSVAVLFVAILTTLHPSLWILTDPLFGVGFTMCIAAIILTHGEPVRSQESWLMRTVVRLGILSYSVYLFHLQLSWLVAPLITKLPGLALPLLARLVWLFISIQLIRIIFAWVEQPFLRAPKQGEQLFGFYTRLQRAFGIVKRAPQAELPAA